MRLRPASLALACLVALVLPATAAADWPPVGIPISGPACGHAQAQLLLDPVTSDVLVIFQQSDCTGNHSMLAQRVGSTGGLAPGWPGGGVVLSSATPDLRAAPDGHGGIFDVYSVISGPGSGVYLEAVRGDGTHEPGATGWPIAATSGSAGYPALTPDGAGGALMAWIADTAGVVVDHLLPDGSLDPAWPGAPVRLREDVVVPQTFPKAVASGMLPDGGGGAYVAWCDDRARVMRIAGDGTFPDGWFVGGVSLNTTVPAGPTRIALLRGGAGNTYALWVDRPDAPGPATRATLQHFAATGPPDHRWPSNGLVIFNSPGPVGAPALLPDGTGGALLVWEQWGTPRLLHVLENGRLAPGFPPEGLSPLDAGAQFAGGLYAAARPDSGLMVGWRDARASRPGYRVRWLRNDATPDPVGPDTGRVAIADAQGGSSWEPLGLLGDGAGGAYLAWDRTADSYATLMMSRVGPVSTTGVEPPGPSHAGFELRSAAPNPASRALAVMFSLAHDLPARLELFDLAGRRVRGIEVRGAGAQVARFDDLGAIPAGIYLVRLTEPGSGTRAARVAIVH